MQTASKLLFFSLLPFAFGGFGGVEELDVTNETQNNGVILDAWWVWLPGFTGGWNRGSGWLKRESRRDSGSHIHSYIVFLPSNSPNQRF